MIHKAKHTHTHKLFQENQLCSTKGKLSSHQQQLAILLHKPAIQATTQKSPKTTQSQKSSTHTASRSTHSRTHPRLTSRVASMHRGHTSCSGVLYPLRPLGAPWYAQSRRPAPRRRHGTLIHVLEVCMGAPLVCQSQPLPLATLL